LARAEEQQAVVECLIYDLVTEIMGRGALLAVAYDLDADHQALATQVADQRVAGLHLAQGVEQVLAHLGGVLHVAVLDEAQGCKRRRGRNRVAAEGVAVRTGAPGHDALAGDDRAERHAAGDALRAGDDVRLDAEMLDGPPLARPPDTALYLVGDEQDAVAVTQVAQRREEAGRGHDIAALTKDRLDEDGGNLVAGHEALENRVLNVIHDHLAVVLAIRHGEDR